MAKNNYYFYTGSQNFYIFNNRLEVVLKRENKGFFNPDNLKNPVVSHGNLLKIASSAYQKMPFNTVILPDICFSSQVIDIPNFPFSQVKREEVLNWKLKTLLPYKVNSYNIKYELVEKDTVLFYALPITLSDAINKLMKELGLKCWDIIPESIFLKQLLPQNAKQTLLLVNRADYFIGMLLKDGNIIYLKVRKKVADIPLDQEIDFIKKVIYDRFSLEIEEFLICGEEKLSGFKQIFKGFGFEN